VPTELNSDLLLNCQDVERPQELRMVATGSATNDASTLAKLDTESLPLSGRGAGVFRPVQYLGSKLRVLDAITSLAREAVPQGVGAVDLFAGSTVVSQAFAASGFRTTSVDTQAYTRVFAQALLGIDRVAGVKVDADALLREAENGLPRASL
jgi:hypothetical protein